MVEENIEFPDRQNQFYVIGIGASAGGMHAIQEFLTDLYPDIQAAFVIVQHLSPNFKHLMTEVLQRSTSIPVYEVTQGMSISPNTIYLIPPGKSLTIEDNHLYILDVAATGIKYPINILFQSMAIQYKEKSVGILFSGTGRDGTEGLSAIGLVGGLALIQSLETAEFTDMPENALKTGLVDEILSPAELAQTIFDLVNIGYSRSGNDSLNPNWIDPNHFQQVLKLLSRKEKTDFTYYKTPTLIRRIYHRCIITNSKDLDNYIALLNASATERQNLRHYLLIGATRFFRDEKAWEFLETTVIPELIAQVESEKQLRIWVTACSTGEEAYSMAIIIDEVIKKLNKSINVKIFATDIDSDYLEIAMKGIYPESINLNISPERLSNYFTKKDNCYIVKRELRKKLIFALHDLSKNPGFSHMNLISCRNVLIYMQPQLQEQVLQLLDFSLNQAGILFLGSAEVLGEFNQNYQILDRRWKIYQKNQKSQSTSLSTEIPLPTRPIIVASKLNKKSVQQERLINQVFNLYFQDRLATIILVNQKHKLEQVLLNTANLLIFPIGTIDIEITSMVKPTLQLPLISALNRAKTNSIVQYHNIVLSEQEHELNLNLKIFHDNTKTNNLYLIIIEVESTRDNLLPEVINFSAQTEASEYIQFLERELRESKEILQATIEELEAINQEQQATNEELLASNEEQQATNEELQSANEELYTINNEYQLKIEELIELNNDVDNLLKSINIGVIFLDKNLNIRKFNRAVKRIINLRITDIGRPISELSLNLDCPNFLELLQQQLGTEESFEQEVINEITKDTFLFRLSSYAKDNNIIEGVVLTFVNINQLKAIQKTLHYQALHDSLTKLPNRGFLLEMLNKAIVAKDNQSSIFLAILYIDLDSFKEINDSLGHKIGDMVLIKFSKEIQKSLRNNDTLSRVGGDEFVILVDEISDEQEAYAMTERIYQSLSNKWEISSHNISISASIGIAFYHHEDKFKNSPDILIDNADIAMYHAKKQGKNKFQIFSDEMRTETQKLLLVKNELVQALEEQQFCLYFQPVIDLKTEKINGWEALVRWNHPQRGIILPNEFLPYLNDSPLLVKLEQYILNKACCHFGEWLQQYELARNSTFSVNLSSQFLNDSSCISLLQNCLANARLSPSALIVELVESSLIANISIIKNKLLQIRAMGIQIALDDFGTGFSSLSHLHEFPIDIIKIDRSFIWSLSHANEIENSNNIVKVILSIATQLELTTVAEGVETFEQLEFLRNHGCNSAQGYLFSHPLSVEDASIILKYPEVLVSD
ncbi:EAL domain-containing protein [Gloeocapsa sp. PCC 73106]|uniref:EAL domain-containing protein n=1 Tax=Gloeocapsa sp. PCC 73106 TaxID=102232 RepID=UPI0002E93615|nr:EAL domain-containing protein [Gloeocapsa sp. PCC 73106]